MLLIPIHLIENIASYLDDEEIIKMNKFCDGVIFKLDDNYDEKTFIKYKDKFKFTGVYNYMGNKPESLPIELKELEFCSGFNEKLKSMKKLKNLEIIIFNREFNKKISKEILPDSLEEIYFGSEFSQELDDLPDNIKKIGIMHDFDKKLDKLPKGLEVLDCGNWNVGTYYELNNLPENLIELELSPSYNYPINNLPKKLKRLIIGYDFSQDIEYLPETLEYLETSGPGEYYIKKLPDNLKECILYSGININHIDTLPIGLKSLMLPYYFDRDIEPGYFPDGLEYIGFQEDYKKVVKQDCFPIKIKRIKMTPSKEWFPDDLPDNLEELELSLGDIYKPLNNLPKELKKLKLYHTDNICNNIFDNLKNNIKYIEISLRGGKCVNINNFPMNLERLKLHSCNIPLSDKNLPCSLKYLYIEGNYNQKIDNLPENLEELEIYYSSLEGEINNLPSSLKKLVIMDCDNFKSKLDNLPKNLKILEFGKNLGEEFFIEDTEKILDNLPENLEELELCNIFTKINSLPKNLKKISVCNRELSIRVSDYPYPKHINLCRYINECFYDRSSFIKYNNSILKVFEKIKLWEAEIELTNTYDYENYFKEIENDIKIIENITKDNDIFNV